MRTLLNLRTRLLALAERLSFVPMLLARVTLLFVFAPTGWGKLHSIDHVTGFFTELGIPWPHANAILVGTLELVGGTLIGLGLAARLAAVPLIGSMAVAILTAKRDQIAGVGDLLGLEEFVYIVLLVWVLVAGAGPLSLDRLLDRRLKRVSAST